jgi:glutathione transport system substrate-binding protein
MKRSRSAACAAVAAVSAVVLAACGGGGGGATSNGSQGLAACDSDPVNCNAATDLQQGGQITYTIEKNIDNWNPMSSDGDVFDLTEPNAGYLPRVFYTAPDLTLKTNDDLVDSVTQTSTNPQTIVYKIKQNAVWDDGTPINADDFIYNWKIQNGKDCPPSQCDAASTQGFDQVKSVTGSDNGKTVTIVMAKPYADWKTMYSGGSPLLPAHIAAQHGDVNTPAGLGSSWKYFSTTMPTFSGGPYKISNFQNNVALTEVPNPKWYGKTKPHLDRIIFRIITDATQEAPALANNEVQVIYPQPQVDLVNQVKNIPQTSYDIGLGLQWEHFDFNLKNPFLSNQTVRQALFTAVDRNAIIAKTVGQFTDKVKPLNSLVFVNNQPGYQDNVSATGLGSGDMQKAADMLKQAGYTNQNGTLTGPSGPVPAMRIRYTAGNAIRQSECELFAQEMKQLGVTFNVVPTASLGDTTSQGDFDAIVFAWVSSPFPVGNAQQTFLSTSQSNYGHYNDPKVDQLLNEAATQTDQTAEYQKLNDADKIIAQGAYELPLYQKPTFIAAYGNVANVRNNSSLDGPTYNIVDWGLRTGS